jgi:hypothetical protein
MAVSIREMLGDVRAHLDAVPIVDAEHAAAAVAGLAPIGRALDRLYGCRPHLPYGDEAQPPQAAELTRACLEAARCWPDGAGRVADLLGVAADTIGRSASSFTHEQRWALTEALAETARRCTDAAHRFQPYAAVPQLAAVRAAAVACERRAAGLPARAADRTALDHLVPASHITGGASDRIVDAAAALHLAITGRWYYPRLHMADVVITLNAAQLATAHAAAALREATALAEPHPRRPAHSPGLPGLAAPDAWRAARAGCASFDDGTKLRPPDGSPVASAAARLGHALLDHLGPIAEPTTRTALTEPRTLQALQTVTGLLPEVATGIHRATQLWLANRQLWAPERRLLAYEDRNDVATSTERAAPADYSDLEPVADTLRNAARLTSSLTSELAQHAPTPARQPYLSETHTAATVADPFLSLRAQSAHDALRRAHALHPTEWALPTRPRPIHTDQTADQHEPGHDPIRRARAAVDRLTARRDQRERQRDEQARIERLTRWRHEDHGVTDGWDAGR